MNEAFGLFAHVNALQRDMCPSQTKFEGEIIAMTLDLFHADAVTDTEPVGLVTTGGTGSILHAMIAYREHGRGARRHPAQRRSSPRPRTPRSTRRCHLFGIEVRNAPVDPETTHGRRRLGRRRTSTTTPSRSSARPATTATAPSTRSRSCRTSRSSTASACTSTAASAAASCRSARSSATTSRSSTSASPASRASRPTRTSTATRSRARRCSRSATRRCATASTSSSPAGAAASTAPPASRAPARAACSPRRGPRWSRSAARATCSYAKAIFETADAMKAAVRSHPELRIMGDPTFVFSFTSDEFDIYHVNDFMRTRGLALQRPAVPERDPHGGHPPADPARRGRGVRRPTSPTRSRTPSEHTAEAPKSRRDLRRRRRRPDRRGRRVHPRRSWPT